jgi:S1-C subfamily serine protease
VIERWNKSCIIWIQITSLSLYSLLFSISCHGQNTTSKLIDSYLEKSDCSIGVVCVKKDSLWYYGTGFIFKDPSTIVTAYHGIKNADAIFYKACGHLTEISIDTIFVDQDVVLLKANSPLSNPLILGQYSEMKVKDSIVTIGFNNGLEVEKGEIIKIFTDERNNKFIRYKGFGQTGYSGGPILNSQGKVIGVTLRGNEKLAELGQSEGVAIYIDFVKN